MADEQPTQPEFSADSPYGICELYAAGKLSRERTVEELARWPYKPYPVDDGYDWLSMGSSEGTWMEVQAGERRGLIDIDMYGEVQQLQDVIKNATSQ